MCSLGPFVAEMVYDPDQDPEEKRAVRKNYRKLAKTMEGRLYLKFKTAAQSSTNICRSSIQFKSRER